MVEVATGCMNLVYDLPFPFDFLSIVNDIKESVMLLVTQWLGKHVHLNFASCHVKNTALIGPVTSLSALDFGPLGCSALGSRVKPTGSFLHRLKRAFSSHWYSVWNNAPS